MSTVRTVVYLDDADGGADADGYIGPGVYVFENDRIVASPRWPTVETLTRRLSRSNLKVARQQRAITTLQRKVAELENAIDFG